MDIRRPGFLEGLQKSEETPLSKLLGKMKDFKPAFVVEKFCGDPDFAEAFVEAVPDAVTQEQFLIHSSKYANGDQDYDPKYVFFFRRTLPSNTPKPEERWTNEFIQVRNGLRVEIPEGPHRLHSIIVCDSLTHLLEGGEKEGETNPFTDGEIVVNAPRYDQNTSICKFKPHGEKEDLEKYLQQEGALSVDAVLDRVKGAREY